MFFLAGLYVFLFVQRLKCFHIGHVLWSHSKQWLDSSYSFLFPFLNHMESQEYRQEYHQLLIYQERWCKSTEKK